MSEPSVKTVSVVKLSHDHVLVTPKLRILSIFKSMIVINSLSKSKINPNQTKLDLNEL